MKNNIFPEKPTSQFTNEQILQRNEILSEEVKHITFDDIKHSYQLIEAFSKSSFQARQIGTGAKLYKKELEGKTTIIWSLAGSIFSAGLRQLVIESLRNNLNQITSLSFKFIETQSNTNNQFNNRYHLYINGADNEGIVHAFSKFLSSIDINIDEVSTKIENAPMSATPLFMMDIVIGSKTKLDIGDVSKNLNEIATKLGVDVSLKSI